MALRTFLQSKIHGATLTGANIEYEGSIAICPELLEASGILPFEQVEVYNIDNGERLTTYVIRGEKGEICLNGAAAHKGKPGQRVIIASYIHLSSSEIQTHTPKLVFVDKNNTIMRVDRGQKE
ncbi:aspartate 1-decarboxylase [Desulfovulcanus sp.]